MMSDLKETLVKIRLFIEEKPYRISANDNVFSNYFEESLEKEI